VNIIEKLDTEVQEQGLNYVKEQYHASNNYEHDHEYEQNLEHNELEYEINNNNHNHQYEQENENNNINKHNINDHEFEHLKLNLYEKREAKNFIQFYENIEKLIT